MTTSPAWVEQVGPVPDGAVGLLTEVYPDLAKLDRQLRAVLDGVPATSRALGSADTAEGSLVTRIESEAGGRHSAFEFRIGPWRSDDGTPAGALVACFDVTAEATQRAELEEARLRYALVIESAGVGIWDWLDVEGDAEYWSPRFYEQLGYEPAELPATLSNFRDLLHPDDVERTFDAVTQHFEHGAPFDIEYRMQTKGGEYRWYRARGIAARDAAGAPTRMIGSLRDIDDQRRAERNLHRMNEDLEHFAHAAAHDLREPARRQQMLVDLVLDEHGADLAEDVRRDLETIRNQSTEMLAMLTGLRALTGLSGPALSLEDVDLADLAERVVADVLAEHGDAEVTIDLPDEVRAYGCLVELLLHNLVRNALHHGSEPLGIRLDHARNDDGIVCYSVSNTWDGDRTKVSQRLFRPFVGSSDGSGLGLSLCKRIVDRHRGEIRASAEPGLFRIDFTLETT